MDTHKIEKLQFEINEKENPISINLGNIGHILGIELEFFDWIPGFTPPSNYLGVAVNGLRGRYNRYGQQINTLKTIPFKDNRFLYQQADNDESINISTNDCAINFCFTYKSLDSTNTLNPSYITFVNNYLLNFSVIVQKY